MMYHLPTKKFKYLRQTRDTVAKIAAEVMTEKQNDIRKGLDGGKDLLSILLRANAGEDERRKMSVEEIVAGVT
jgi:cytochrome P450